MLISIVFPVNTSSKNCFFLIFNCLICDLTINLCFISSGKAKNQDDSQHFTSTLIYSFSFMKGQTNVQPLCL